MTHFSAAPSARRAVLFDRDDTLVVDVPYNADPDAVVAMPAARDTLAALRGAGVLVGLVSNQSGVGRGLLDDDGVRAVNIRIEQMLGPFHVWAWCPHRDDEGCGCRKPEPGLVEAATRALGVRPDETVVVGDIGSDVEAARRAGAEGVLVPTSRTRSDEVNNASTVCADLGELVDLVLGGAR